MFDAYAMLELLLTKAFRRETIGYGELYSMFNVDDSHRNDFFNTLEPAARRITRDVDNRPDTPIYTAILRKADGFPASGFYDMFMNRNHNSYQRLAGNISSKDAYEDPLIKQQIYTEAMSFLENDLQTRFPNMEIVESFIAEVRMARDI